MGMRRWIRTPAVGAVLMTLLSCTVLDAPTSASRDNSVLLVDVSGNSIGDDRHAEHERLHDLLEHTRDSLKAERELHREEFKAARKQWELFKKWWEGRRKQGDVLELLRCEPQEYSSDVELIGPDGGSLKVGPHELKIPQGALDHEVVISAVAPVSDLIEVQLQPEGLRSRSERSCTLPASSWARPRWASPGALRAASQIPAASRLASAARPQIRVLLASESLRRSGPSHPRTSGAGGQVP